MINAYQADILKIGFLTVCTLMTVLWGIGVTRRNAGWVDFGWVFGLVVLAILYAVLGDGYGFRKAIIATIVTLWGIRLGGMLLSRLMTEGEDKRYQKIRAAFGGHADLKLFGFFQFQALLDVILSIPFFVMCFNPGGHLSPVEWLGISIWFVGFVGEITADEQLRAFKADPSNKGKVCEAGLWYYSRHPNYFFEWLMWLGYFVMAVSSPSGWMAVTAPLLMLFFLLKVSGVPPAEEQSLRSRGDAFREYQRTTSVFVPLPKRKG